MTRRWVVDKIGAPLFEQLASQLSGSELQSVLLEVMRCRAKRRAPADMLAQYRRDPFCRPAAIDQRSSVLVDAHLLAAAEDFDAVELSPVAPLGACSTVAVTDQNRVLSALRSTEVVADPTNVLALECAERLKASPESVHFATCQRVIRAQPVPKLPGYTSHFRIFVLASAGIETRDHAFTVQTIERHVLTMLRALDRLEQHGFAFGTRRIEVLATPERARLADRVAAGLRDVRVVRSELNHEYYAGVRYNVVVTAPEGDEVTLIDGGVFDWLARLTGNRRAVYVASGCGAQLIPLRFCQLP